MHGHEAGAQQPSSSSSGSLHCLPLAQEDVNIIYPPSAYAVDDRGRFTAPARHGCILYALLWCVDVAMATCGPFLQPASAEWFAPPLAGLTPASCAKMKAASTMVRVGL